MAVNDDGLTTSGDTVSNRDGKSYTAHFNNKHQQIARKFLTLR